MYLQHNKGNALFLILIAVALFAALSYAVTQSGRGGGTIDKETALLHAAQITQYGASIRTTVTRMVLTGTAIADLEFKSGGTPPCTTGENCVFVAEGGGATYRPAADFNATNHGYQSDMAVQNIGTAANETLMRIRGFDLNVCNAINKGLNLSHSPVVAWGGALPIPSYPGEEAFCVTFIGVTDYLHVLVAQ